MRATKQFSDAEYVNFVESYCHSRGWLWEFQSPQAPYPNVCDLAVFPAMSRRHSHLLAERTDSVASKDEIWAAAEKVWAELENIKLLVASYWLGETLKELLTTMATTVG